MEYLNNFSPTDMLLDEQLSLKEFGQLIRTETIMDVWAKTGAKLMNLTFDPDKIVHEKDEVLVEFIDWRGQAIITHFKSDNIPGITKGGFSAAEMFYKLITFQKSIDEHCGYFKSIEYVEDMEWEGKTLSLYRADFGNS